MLRIALLSSMIVSCWPKAVSVREDGVGNVGKYKRVKKLQHLQFFFAERRINIYDPSDLGEYLQNFFLMLISLTA